MKPGVISLFCRHFCPSPCSGFHVLHAALWLLWAAGAAALPPPSAQECGTASVAETAGFCTQTSSCLFLSLIDISVCCSLQLWLLGGSICFFCPHSSSHFDQSSITMAADNDEMVLEIVRRSDPAITDVSLHLNEQFAVADLAQALEGNPHITNTPWFCIDVLSTFVGPLCFKKLQPERIWWRSTSRMFLRIPTSGVTPQW